MLEQKGSNPKPKRYLEVGAGSGALTHYLIEKMAPSDHLDIVENDPTFCALLRQKFGDLNQVAIHELSILDFEGKNFDFLLSSLPLNAFRAETVGKILNKYEQLVRKGGRLAYFEYLGVETLKQRLLFGKSAADFKNMISLKKEFAVKYGREIDKIWWNFPPARVFHCLM